MRKKSRGIRLACLFGILAVAVRFAACPSPGWAEQTGADPTEKKLVVSLDAGPHERYDVPVAVLVDAGKAQSVLVRFSDGSPGRAQLVEPGMLQASQRGPGRKELYFAVPKMAKGETSDVVVELSERPVEGRRYVWTGDPCQSRRLSCAQCHQGLSLPTAEELRDERRMLETTGKVPPLVLPKILPTTKGRDFRWHEKMGKYQTSACWECHGRHMVQYEFGQSLDPDLPWSLDPPHGKSVDQRTALRSVYYQVFRVKGDRVFSDGREAGRAPTHAAIPCGIHYGFQRAAVVAGPERPAAAPSSTPGEPVVCADVLQLHSGILSEEAGKIVGRQTVLLQWVAGPQRRAIAREERQLTVKNMRARNGSFSLWIDMASRLESAGGTVRLDGDSPLAGFRLVAPFDAGAVPEQRESADWKAITFVFEGATYTAVCLNHPANPKPLAEESSARSRDPGRPGPAGRVRAVGYGFSAQIDPQHPLFAHYRLWIQGGRLTPEEMQSFSNDFVDPIRIHVK